MGFQWDAKKSAANEAKHDISFAEASLIFRGRIVSRQDTRRDYGEERFMALGVSDGRLLRVVYTKRNDDIRIISAWRASKNDQKAFG